MKNNAKKDLSIKSMLLFNKIDMEVKNLYNLSLDVKKRAKALDHIIDTYRLVLNPFLKDEDKDFQNKYFTMLTEKRNKIYECVESKLTVEGLNVLVSPLVGHLKQTVTSCKIDFKDVDRILS